jgi:hypothetical protein
LGIEDFAAPGTEAIESRPAITISSDLQAVIENFSDAAQRCWVSMPVPGSDRAYRRRTLSDIVRCLATLVSRGVLEIAVPDGYVTQRDWDQLRNASPIKFVIRGTEQDDAFSPPPPLARASVLPLELSDATVLENTMSLQRPMHIIFFPDHLSDPRQPLRRLRDMVPHCALDAFVSRLAL